MTGAAPYVFVSYASADRERVLRVVDALASAGIATWLDQHAIDAGSNWGEEIAAAIAGCSAFALMSSAAALSSRNVRQEIALAWKYGRPYLPLLLDATPFPREIEYWLETAQWVEVLDRPVSEWLPRVQRALERLGTAIGSRDAGLEMRGVATWEQAPTQHPSLPIPNPESPIPTPRRHRVRPFLVGREREQAQLEGWLDDALTGRGQLVLLGGEAGIGKTTLTSWLLWLAEQRGALARVGGCYDLATTPPYGPWVEITRGWPEEAGLPRLPHELREGTGLDTIHSQAALFDLVARFLGDASAALPLVLLLEDLHWADQASLDLLRSLSRSVGEWPLLLIVTYRDDELTRRHPLFGLLPALAREPHARRLTLTRLDEDALAELVTRRYELPAADVARLVAYVQRLTEGNPFFSGEVLRALEEAGALARDGDGWRLVRLEQIQVPSLVRQVIESRLSRLSDDTRRLLEVAAVIGHELPIDLWVEVSGEDEALLADALERATEARLIEELPNQTHVRFTHALVRETLYEGLVSLRRRAWHRKVADALIAAPRPSPDAVAGHLLAAGDARAFDWLVQAGDRARATFAGADAIQRYEQAVALIADDPAREQERGWLLFRIGLLHRLISGGPAAPQRGIPYLDAARDAGSACGDRTLEAYATVARGLLTCISGDLETGLPILRVGAAAVDQLTVTDLERSGPLLTTPMAEEGTIDRSRLPDYVAVNLARGVELLWLGNSGYFQDVVAIGEPFIASLEGMTLVVPAVHARCDACFALGTASAFLGRPDRAREWYSQAAEGFESFGHHGMTRLVAYNWHLFVNRPYAPDDPLERARIVRVMEQAAPRPGEGWLVSVRPIEASFTDRWDDIVPTSRSDSSRLPLGVAGVFQMGEIARLRGQRDDAWSALAGRQPPIEPHGEVIGFTHRDLPLLRLGINLHLDDGDLDGARTWLAAWDLWLERTGVVLGRAEGALHWARYHHIAGDITQAREQAERALTHASDPRQPLALVAAHRFLGELLTETGAHDDAAEHLRESLSLAEPIGIRSEIAWTQFALAELHAARGEHEQARELLAEVRTVFEPLGAVPTLERAAALERRINP
jgi:tetratricopeptide (TPR) repeat protein